MTNFVQDPVLRDDPSQSCVSTKQNVPYWNNQCSYCVWTMEWPFKMHLLSYFQNQSFYFEINENQNHDQTRNRSYRTKIYTQNKSIPCSLSHYHVQKHFTCILKQLTMKYTKQTCNIFPFAILRSQSFLNFNIFILHRITPFFR